MEHGYPASRYRRPARRRTTRRQLLQGQRSGTSGQAPLLLLDAGTPVGPSVVSTGGPRGLDSDFSSYRPPQLSQTSTQQDSGNDDDCLPPVWFVPSQHHLPPVNQNPAPDLAFSLCSHGCCCCQCVRTQEIGFTEDCGRFEQMLTPGFYCLAWPYQTVAGRLSLRVQQMDVTCETKTADHVFLHVTVSLLFRVASVHSYEAFYSLRSPSQVIQTSVLDVLRSTIPKQMTLDEVFCETDSISAAVFVHLQDIMHNYGYDIVNSLVTCIRPNARVRASMNEIGASRRRKVAIAHQAEAAKVQRIRRAEAAAEGDEIRGVGMARERVALATGMRESVLTWTEMDVRVASPPTAAEVMELLLITQYLDILTTIGADQLQLEYQATSNELRSALRVSL